MDALLTQRPIAPTMVEQGGDDVMVVKEPQPRLRADIAWVVTLPPSATAKPLRGRSPWAMGASSSAIARRVRPASAPALGPGWRRSVRWDVTSCATKRARNGSQWSMGSRACALSGHPPSACSPWYAGSGRWSTRRMGSALSRGDAERSQVRWGNMPQVMAACRNPAIGLLRYAGYPHIAAACRGWLPSRYKRWRSSGLHWKTK